MPAHEIMYSERYSDEFYEYRHVMLPQDIALRLPHSHLLSEPEWRALGIQQSRGWVHYTFHRPEPHIMLFRRPLNYDRLACQVALVQDTQDHFMREYQAAIEAGFHQ